MREIKIQKNNIISVLTAHAGDIIDLGLIMNMLVEMENKNGNR